MQRLFIRVDEDGNPVEHPITEDNMRIAFPHIDLDDLPPDFAPFVRTTAFADLFQINEGVEYVWDGTAYTDVHLIRDMTEEEKANKIAELYAARPNEYLVWDEEKFIWTPPPKPTNDRPWDWNGQEWVELTEPPFPSWTLSEDGSRYEAPIPYPIDDNDYIWIEEELIWRQINE